MVTDGERRALAHAETCQRKYEERCGEIGGLRAHVARLRRERDEAVKLAATYRQKYEDAQQDGLKLRAARDLMQQQRDAARRSLGIQTARDEREWYSPTQAAKYLGVSLRTIYVWLERGWLESSVSPSGRQRFRKEQLQCRPRSAHRSADEEAQPPAQGKSQISATYVR